MGDLENLEKTVQELAGYVQTIGKAVLGKNGFMEDEPEPEYDGMGNGHQNPMDAVPGEEEMLARMHKHGNYMKDDPMGMPGEDPIGMPEEDPMGMGMEDPMGEFGEEEMPYDEDEMAMAYYKARRMTKAMRSKGFAHAAKANSDEHDAPFGDKDSSVKGNEAQPAGDQGGDREDESFGPGGNSLRANANGVYKMRQEIASLTKKLASLTGEGTVISKAIVPARPGVEDTQESQVVLTRDMQEQIKGRSYREINKLREQIGDLPQHGIIG